MEARLSSKGQIVIPKELRDKLGLTTQNSLRIYEQDGKIIIESITPTDNDPWEGMEFLDLHGDADSVLHEALGALGKHLTGE